MERGITVLLLCLLAAVRVQTLPEVIKVGGMFETGAENLDLAFRYAVHKVNTNVGWRIRSRLSAQVEKIDRHDSFQAIRKVCKLLNEGVAAVFGPQTSEAGGSVHSTCEILQVPNVLTRPHSWPYAANHSINLYPHSSALGKAYVDYIRNKTWKSLAIIYEENDALIRFQEVLKDCFSRDVKVIVRQFPPGQEYRKLLKELAREKVRNLVVDVRMENILSVLNHAQEVDMLSDYHNYFFTSLDLYAVNLEAFQFSGTNITGFRLVDEDSSDFQEVTRDWQASPLYFGSNSANSNAFLTTEAALMYDAVQLFAKALGYVNLSQNFQTRPISCETEQVWDHGHLLVGDMKMINSNGLTGEIKFDHNGLRTDFKLHIIEMTPMGLRKVGEWNIHSGISLKTNFSREFEDVIQQAKNKTFVITTYPNKPYAMLKEDHENYEGNDKFEGYVVDLIQEIAKLNSDLKYRIKFVDDNQYGSQNALGQWNGMVGELIDGKADMVIADLTITYQREQAVDFTMPFMNLGISILFKKPTKQDPNLFSFLSPLSIEVWFYMMTAFLGVSILMFIIARLSPGEWTNPHPCNLYPEELENQFTLVNSLWFTIGCLMQQGSDVLPRAISTRVVAGIWWFFTLIMVSSYTANLAAFLTVQRMASPIENAEDLAKQTAIKYGCVVSGSTKNFFKTSKIPTYERMWTTMDSDDSVFVENNDKGVERVKKGNYAFLMESTTIEYRVERDCDLTQVGTPLDSKGYGIGTPTGSPYRAMMSRSILHLQEGGVLHALKDRWWKQRKDGGQCLMEDSSASASASELGLSNVGGVFLVLLVGVIIAGIIAVGEFVWISHEEASDEREPIYKQLYQELKFAIMCGGSTKPVRQSSTDQQPESNSPFTPLTGFNTPGTNDVLT